MQEEKLTKFQIISALLSVAKTTFKVAPSAAIVQLIGSIISATVPVVTTFFVGLTTTALAEAFMGNGSAGARAIELVIITALLAILMTSWRSFESLISQFMRYKVEAATTNQLYEQYLSLDFWRYDDKDTMDTYDKAKRFSMIFPHIFSRLSQIVTTILAVMGSIVALVLVNWWLPIIVLVAIVPTILIQVHLSKVQTNHWKVNVQTRRTISIIEWDLLQSNSISELRIYGLVKRILGLRLSLRDKDERARIELEKSFLPKRLAADLLQAAVEAGILIWITIQIIAKAQPIGQFLFVQQIVSRAFGEAGSIVSLINDIDEDVANLKEYQRFMLLDKGRVGGIKLPKQIKTIEFNDVSFKYINAEKNTLNSVSFKINGGERVAIVGENGAGKSTIVKILVGLYQPSKGEVLVNDHNLLEVDIDSWHKHISMLGQDFVQFGFATARHNVEYGKITKAGDDTRFKDAVEEARAGFIYDLPQKEDSYINNWMEDDSGHKGQMLSGGQWQRVALARNFYRDSEVIILDEPTSAIDALAEAEIFDNLFAKRDKTVIVVSHRLTTVKKADKILVIKNGQIVETGTYKELVKLNGEFLRLFKRQI